VKRAIAMLPKMLVVSSLDMMDFQYDLTVPSTISAMF
jgi:hypothetical protein